MAEDQDRQARDAARKATHDKLLAEQRDLRVKGGESYEEATRNAEQTMRDASERLDRRDREKGR